MEKLNLWQKINAVMKDVEYLNKDDNVSTGGSNSYRAISEEKVTTVVGAAIRKHGLVILPIEQEHLRQDEQVKDRYGNEKTNRITTVNVKYKIVNIDNPEEFEILSSGGTGVDTQDKGIGKAMTYAYKYLLLRTFSIATGDDPDKVSSEEYGNQLTGGNKDNKPGDSNSKPDNNKISTAQVKRMFAIAGKDNTAVVKEILSKYKYFNSKDVKTSDYENICKEIEKAVAK